MSTKTTARKTAKKTTTTRRMPTKNRSQHVTFGPPQGSFENMLAPGDILKGFQTYTEVEIKGLGGQSGTIYVKAFPAGPMLKLRDRKTPEADRIFCMLQILAYAVVNPNTHEPLMSWEEWQGVDIDTINTLFVCIAASRNLIKTDEQEESESDPKGK